VRRMGRGARGRGARRVGQVESLRLEFVVRERGCHHIASRRGRNISGEGEGWRVATSEQLNPLLLVFGVRER
jgi:hypothetical protein